MYLPGWSSFECFKFAHCPSNFVHCLSRYVLCPSIVRTIMRHSEKFIAHGLTHDLKFRHLHVVARRVNLIFHLITFHFVSVCYRFISVYDFLQF